MSGGIIYIIKCRRERYVVRDDERGRTAASEASGRGFAPASASTEVCIKAQVSCLCLNVQVCTLLR